MAHFQYNPSGFQPTSHVLGKGKTLIQASFKLMEFVCEPTNNPSGLQPPSHVLGKGKHNPSLI